MFLFLASSIAASGKRYGGFRVYPCAFTNEMEYPAGRLEQ